MSDPIIRRRFRVALLSSVLVLAVLALPMTQGRIYPYDDLGQFHLPLRAFYADCLRNGDGFDWCPHLLCGFYLQGEGQAGMYHPLHFLLYRCLPLDLALNLEVWLNYPVLLAGMYFFLRRRGLPADAALFGAAVFTFSASTMLHFMHVNGIAVLAHLPWLLLLIDVTMTAHSRRGAALAGVGVTLLTASQLLLGLPQYVYFSLLAEGLYALFLLGLTGRLGRLTALAGWLALGVLGGAVQLLPTWEALNDSRRQVPTAEFLAAGSLHPANLSQLVAPYLYESRVFGGATGLGIDTHEFGLYPGAAATVLWLWLLVRLPRDGPRRSLALAALGLAGMALLLAFGRYTPLFELTRRLPGLNLFRCPCKYLALFHLATSVAAALAFADLADRARTEVPWRPIALAPFAALLALALPPASSGVFAAWGCRVAGVLLLTAAALLVLGAAFRVRGALAGLILFAVLDQGIYGLSFIRHTPPIEVAAYAASASAPPARPGERVRGTLTGLEMDVLTLRGLSLADGYVALYPRTALDFGREDVLRLAGVSWAHEGGSWRLVPNPLPRARLVSRAAISHDHDADLAGVDPATMALVDENLSLGGGTPGHVSLSEDRPGWIVVDVEAGSRQLLTISESYHRGWRVRVNGEEAPVVRAYGQFLGCIVEKGTSRVEFQFAPESLALGRRLSVLALVILAPAGAALVGGRAPPVRG